jgi:hypothetical protein
LRSIWPEGRYRDPHRDTGPTAIAIRAIGETPAAAKAPPDKLAINLGIDQMAWRGDLGPGNAFGQVTARIGGRRIKLERREREIV